MTALYIHHDATGSAVCKFVWGLLTGEGCKHQTRVTRVTHPSRTHGVTLNGITIQRKDVYSASRGAILYA